MACSASSWRAELDSCSWSALSSFCSAVFSFLVLWLLTTCSNREAELIGRS